MTDEKRRCGVNAGSLKRAAGRIAYIAGQAIRLMLSAACAFAVGYLSFDWMTAVFDPMSAVFALAVMIGLGGCIMFLALDKLTIRRRDK